MYTVDFITRDSWFGKVIGSAVSVTFYIEVLYGLFTENSSEIFLKSKNKAYLGLVKWQPSYNRFVFIFLAFSCHELYFCKFTISYACK